MLSPSNCAGGAIIGGNGHVQGGRGRFVSEPSPLVKSDDSCSTFPCHPCRTTAQRRQQASDMCVTSLLFQEDWLNYTHASDPPTCGINNLAFWHGSCIQ